MTTFSASTHTTTRPFAMLMRYFPFAILVLIACSNDDTAIPGELPGTWELTEVYLDPGDGSGSFVPTDYDRRITFYMDSTYRTSRDICTFSGGIGEAGEGRYDPGRQIIFPTFCRINAEYGYTIDGRELTLSYRCIEGCAERYVKIRD